MLPAVFSQSPDKYQGLVVDWSTVLTASGLSGGGALDGVIAIRLLSDSLLSARHTGDAMIRAGLRTDVLVRS
jgi:hypothetical protein